MDSSGNSDDATSRRVTVERVEREFSYSEQFLTRTTLFVLTLLVHSPILEDNGLAVHKYDSSLMQQF